ncbi:movement protein [Angelica bushy stunt virus]|uniref:Movement protein n=1 Tax=Angelica bushy stunt virus TaxID=1808970 RepID=A0A140GL58_9VIRU|nr:movement protein [Angelica bushy stunt virus]AMN10076.1 movement protein [Angelica bushy stunt virus]
MTEEKLLEKSEQSEELNIFESHENETGFTGNLLIEQSLLKKILKQPFNINSKDVFKQPNVMNKIFNRKNHIYYHVSTKEFHVDSSETHGRVYLPLITREEINNALAKIDSKIRSKINMVHFGAIKILLKAEFAAGIDYPIRMALLDNRINNRRDCVLGAAIGNLAYQNFMFTVYPKFGVSLQTKNINQILSFVHQANNENLMNSGDKVFSITYVVAYALTNSHHSIDYKHQEFITLDDIFSEIGSTVPKQFVNINNDNENWTIDIAKEKPRIGDLRRTISGTNLRIGEPSSSIIAPRTYRQQSNRFNEIDLKRLSDKVDYLTNVLESS